MSAAFSFGPLGAMTDLVVAPAVQVDNGRELKTTVTSRGVRWAQRARRNPRTWTVSRPWQDPQFARLLSLAASGLGGDMWLYDRACARQNMLPARLSVGDGTPISVGYPGEVVRTNLLTNPSFEGGADQAAPFNGGHGGSATSATSTDWAASGTRSLKVTPNGTTTAAARYFGPTSGDAAAFPLAAGKTYTIAGTIHIPSGYVPNTVGDRGIYVGTVSSSGTINYTFASSQVAPATPGDYRLVVTVAIPADAKGGFFRLCIGSTVTPTYWDAITVEEGVTDGSYFDGATAAHGDVSYRWTGTANASTSEEAVGAGAVVQLGAVTWSIVRVPVLAGRTYTVSATLADTDSSVWWSGAPGTGGVVATAPGYAAATFTAKTTGLIALNRWGTVAGVRVYEGVPDGLFLTSPGTPCRVAVADPEQTYQLVTDQETRIDYQVTLYEVGDTGTI